MTMLKFSRPEERALRVADRAPRAGQRPDRDHEAGAVTGHVRAALRLEGAAILAGSVLAYRALGGPWMAFALLFLVPDLSMTGYLVGRRFGAATYNLGHTYLAPAALALGGALLAGANAGAGQFYLLALIWTAHIGFDRLLGYGLKYTHAFGATHLGWRGGASPPL